MFKFSIFRRHDDRTTNRRPQPRRRPLVEGLEGRQMLSGFAVTAVSAIQGGHPGMGAVAQVQGGHIGLNVA